MDDIVASLYLLISNAEFLTYFPSQLPKTLDYESSYASLLATAIHTWKYLILSNFRSQAGAGMVSTAIGDGVGIPCAVAFFLFIVNRDLASLFYNTECIVYTSDINTFNLYLIIVF